MAHIKNLLKLDKPTLTFYNIIALTVSGEIVATAMMKTIRPTDFGMFSQFRFVGGKWIVFTAPVPGV